jgi:hypothetical protein
VKAPVPTGCYRQLRFSSSHLVFAELMPATKVHHFNGTVTGGWRAVYSIRTHLSFHYRTRRLPRERGRTLRVVECDISHPQTGGRRGGDVEFDQIRRRPCDPIAARLTTAGLREGLTTKDSLLAELLGSTRPEVSNQQAKALIISPSMQAWKDLRSVGC